MPLPAALRDPAAALPRIREAAARIGSYVRRTPTVYSYTFSESAGLDVWLKLENLQRTGSFKIRGALNKLLALDPEQRSRGLIAASAGNHAQGVALAARLCEAPATIVMPRSTALIKIQRTEGYGGEVLLHGANYDEAQERARELAAERGLTLVHPFDDEAILLGQGTLGLETIEDVQDLDAIVVPIGGGGLISGLALAVKAVAPHVRIVGVQARGASPMVQSFARGEKVRVEHPDTIAEGIRVGTVGELTYELVRRHVDACVAVEEADIIEAVLQTMEKSKVVAETAGVAGIAALIAGKVGQLFPDARRVCAIVSGGNIDLNLLARIIESGLANQGRLHLVRVRMEDTPGQLSAVLEVLTEFQTNVLDVQHQRAGWKVPLGFVDVEILVETRRAGAGEQIDAALRERGFDLAPG